MKSRALRYMAFAAVILMTAASCQRPQVKKAKILIAGSYWDTIAIVDKETGAVEWRYALPQEYGGPECNSAEVLPDGKILLSFKRGARLIERDQTGQGNDQILWDYIDMSDTAELQTAKHLKDGGFLLGICDGPARLVELDEQGQVRKEVTYDLEIPQPHGQFRRVSKSEVAGKHKGNYIIPVMGRGKIVEIDENGQLVKEFKVPGGPFDAFELENGNLLVALGNRHAMVEVDRETGEIREKLGRDDLDTLRANLNFVAQVTRKFGNTMIANWQGYLPKEKLGIDPQLIELDSARNVIWTFNGRDNGVKNISAFYEFEE